MKEPNPLFISLDNMALATDLYELTMAAAYFDTGLEESLTFELFIRDLPASRSFLLAAGLEQIVHFVTNLRFTDDGISYLRSLEPFEHISAEFFDHLRSLAFSGDIFALEEGTVFFPGEPVLVVSGPPVEAQILETFLLTTINLQSAVASKAARVVHAADGRSVIDFGSRRAHGPQAGVLAARACYIAGCAATSNVLAAMELGIPAVGTAAHSWTMAFDSEREAFEAYHKAFPDTTVLLVDTYDTIEGTKAAAQIGADLKGVRLDSGNIAELSKRARKVLDDAGLRDAKIIASGDLNEYKISDILSSGGVVDTFGVGTEMVTSKDAPALSAVYKLVEHSRDGAPRPVIKLSQKKQTLPGAKQICRFRQEDGLFQRDLLTHMDEPAPEAAEPLLKPIIEGGKLIYDLPSIDQIRSRARAQIDSLPPALRTLTPGSDFPVNHSEHLLNLQAEAASRFSKGRKEA